MKKTNKEDPYKKLYKELAEEGIIIGLDNAVAQILPGIKAWVETRFKEYPEEKKVLEEAFKRRRNDAK